MSQKPLAFLTWERVVIGLLTAVLSLSGFIAKGYADRVVALELEANRAEINQAVTNALLQEINNRVKRIEQKIDKAHPGE